MSDTILWFMCSVLWALDLVLALSLLEWLVTHEDEDGAAMRLTAALSGLGLCEPLTDDEERKVAEYFERMRGREK